MKKIQKKMFQIPKVYFGSIKEADRNQFLEKKTKITLLDGGREWKARINKIYFRIDPTQKRPKDCSLYLDIDWEGDSGNIKEGRLFP